MENHYPRTPAVGWQPTTMDDGDLVPVPLRKLELRESYMCLANHRRAVRAEWEITLPVVDGEDLSGRVVHLCVGCTAAALARANAFTV